MNEVNIKYWFFLSIFWTICSYDFLSKKNRFLRSHGDPMAIHGFTSWITEGIGLTGVSYYFWPKKQIPSSSCHMNFWLLYHFQSNNISELFHGKNTECVPRLFRVFLSNVGVFTMDYPRNQLSKIRHIVGKIPRNFAS
jgi:hypothetical protein